MKTKEFNKLVRALLNELGISVRIYTDKRSYDKHSLIGTDKRYSTAMIFGRNMRDLPYAQRNRIEQFCKQHNFRLHNGKTYWNYIRANTIISE